MSLDDDNINNLYNPSLWLVFYILFLSLIFSPWNEKN